MHSVMLFPPIFYLALLGSLLAQGPAIHRCILGVAAMVIVALLVFFPKSSRSDPKTEPLKKSRSVARGIGVLIVLTIVFFTAASVARENWIKWFVGGCGGVLE